MNESTNTTELGTSLGAANIFLELVMERNGNEHLRPLISAMLIMQDGYPVDQAIWNDWTAAASRVLNKSSDDLLPKARFADPFDKVSFQILVEFLVEASTWATGSKYDELAERLRVLPHCSVDEKIDEMHFTDWSQVLSETKDDPSGSQLLFMRANKS